MKPLKTLTLIFVGLTALLTIGHLSIKSAYLNNYSNSPYHNIEGVGFKSEFYFAVLNENADEIILNFDFLEVDDSIVLQDFQVNINKATLEKIECYTATAYAWPKYTSFSEIPLCDKTVGPRDLMPYSFDFHFSLPQASNPLLVEIRLKYKIGEDVSDIVEKYDYRLEQEWKISPLDRHSDISYLLIIPFAIISFVLVTIYILIYFRQ